MAQSILSRTISAANDNRLVLRSGQATRKFDFGNNWTKIRIGLLLSFDAAASILGTPRFFFGACNYAGGGWGSATTANSIGLWSTVTSWPLALTPAVLGGVGGAAIMLNGAKRIGSTVTTTGNGLTNVSAAPASVRSAWFLEITKGSPFNLLAAGPSNQAAAQTNVTDAQFYDSIFAALMGDINTIIPGYHNMGIGTLTIDEGTNGILDALNIYWDRSVPCELSHVRFRKVS